MYSLPVGDFNVSIDFDDYQEDATSDGLYLTWEFTDGDSGIADRFGVRYYVDDGPTHKTYTLWRINNVNYTGTEYNPGSRPTKYMIVRDGNDLKAYYYDGGWSLMETVDYTGRAANIDTIRIYVSHRNNRGGHLDLDNMTFISCCPAGYPKFWTTTSSTSTTTTV